MKTCAAISTDVISGLAKCENVGVGVGIGIGVGVGVGVGFATDDPT